MQPIHIKIEYREDLEKYAFLFENQSSSVQSFKIFQVIRGQQPELAREEKLKPNQTYRTLLKEQNLRIFHIQFNGMQCLVSMNELMKFQHLRNKLSFMAQGTEEYTAAPIEQNSSGLNNLRDVVQKQIDSGFQQEHLDLLYEQKFAEAAAPNEKGDVSCVWFFIEHWKLKAEEPLISLLSEFQEQMKRISSEPENNSFERPSLGEKPSSGAGDGAALKEYLLSYQQERASLLKMTFNGLHIPSEKRRQLQHTAYLLVDRIDEHQSATDHKIEQFLSLVGLRELFIRKGHTRFHEDLHNTIDRRESSLEPGTIIEVTKRGFLDKTTGDIIRKAFVITAE